MSVMQPCPDSLLARARAGTLSSLEKRQLQAHLVHCETCRVSLVVGQDFDGALAARPDDTLLVTKVVRAVRASAALRDSVSPPRARPGGRLFAYSLAAALLTISFAVGAARPSVRRTVAVFLGLQDRDARTEAPAAGVDARIKPLPMRPKGAISPGGETSSIASALSDAPQGRAEEPNTAPRHEEPNTPPPHGGLVHADSPHALEGSAARDLFAQGNAKRRAGDEPGARRLYQELQQRYPRSPEAEVSRVALGRLLLDRSQDANAALEQFDRAIHSPGQAGQGELAEEALFGRATALMRLGRTDDERKTWLELLERFPGSVYADRAHTRLDEMGPAGAKDGPAPKPALK
jgi:TolA-binding protein